MSVTLHTDVGDIKIELFCEDCPKACENFLALCASDYYNGCAFIRNIKGFIVQTGDPTNTGKNGKSIWGTKFEDEFKENLKVFYKDVVNRTHTWQGTGTTFHICWRCVNMRTVNRCSCCDWGVDIKTFSYNFTHPCSLPGMNPHSDRGMVSMANNGPNANASQFFISYAAQPNLDLKYTLFGRVIDGFDALDELEKLQVNPKTYRPHIEKKINGITIHANPMAA